MATKPSAAQKARGLSLHIGLNGVDPHAYAGWSGDLCACEADARALAAAASRQGFAARTLLTQRATRRAVLQQVRRAAGLLGVRDESGRRRMPTHSCHSFEQVRSPEADV